MLGKGSGNPEFIIHSYIPYSVPGSVLESSETDVDAASASILKAVVIYREG